MKNGYPSISVKNVKKINGHDGQGFSASVYIGGLRVGTAKDDGWGGPLQLNVPKQSMTIINGFARTLPKDKIYNVQPDADIVISELVESAFKHKEYKRHLKNVVIWNPKAKAVYSYKAPWAKAKTQTARLEKLRTNNGKKAVILNTLPIEEAAIYFEK